MSTPQAGPVYSDYRYVIKTNGGYYKRTPARGTVVNALMDADLLPSPRIGIDREMDLRKMGPYEVLAVQLDYRVLAEHPRPGQPPL